MTIFEVLGNLCRLAEAYDKDYEKADYRERLKLLYESAIVMPLSDEGVAREAVCQLDRALGKQEPKDVLNWADREPESTIHCPDCGERCSFQLANHKRFHPNFCPNCGQKLKWK